MLNFVCVDRKSWLIILLVNIYDTYKYSGVHQHVDTYIYWGLFLMPLFHWPAMPRRWHGIRKNEQIRSKISEMVWWNISGATISHVLRISCVSVAHGWRTCDAYGVWMAMPLRMMSRMRTWPLRNHGASGVCTEYIPCTHGDQRDSMAYGGRLYSAWVAYMRTYEYTSLYMWAVNVTFKCPVEYICI